MSRTTALLYLVIATAIWGFAFIAQKSAMGVMGPLTFMASRYLIGGLLILPLALREHSRIAAPITRGQWWMVGLLGLSFFMGSWLQQTGLLFTTVTNGGFLTGLYVFFVPMVMLVVFRTPPHRVVWMAAPAALLGIFLLNGATLDAINQGDLLIIGSAVFWAMQMLVLGRLVRETGRPILMSSISFLAAGALSTIGAFSFETPTFEAIQLGWVQIAYAGILSTSVAFTLQAIGQQHVPAPNAAIVLSAESLFAALGGALLLGERLPAIGYVGAALIFAAIVFVEVIPTLRAQRSGPR